MQDVTPGDVAAEQPECDRQVAVYGYARGCNFQAGARVHLAGVGDFTVCLPLPASSAVVARLCSIDKPAQLLSSRRIVIPFIICFQYHVFFCPYQPLSRS